MELKVHGKTVSYDGSPCGIYDDDPVLGRYGVADPQRFIDEFNSMTKEEAIETAATFRDILVKQTKRDSIPNDKKETLENTLRLTNQF